MSFLAGVVTGLWAGPLLLFVVAQAFTTWQLRRARRSALDAAFVRGKRGRS